MTNENNETEVSELRKFVQIAVGTGGAEVSISTNSDKDSVSTIIKEAERLVDKYYKIR